MYYRCVCVTGGEWTIWCVCVDVCVCMCVYVYVCAGGALGPHVGSGVHEAVYVQTPRLG